MTTACGVDYVKTLDANDALKHFRAEFDLPEGVIYLDGNSLGASPKTALSELETAAGQEWSKGLIRSWNTAGWFSLPLKLGDQIGRLVGAEKGQIAVSDSTSVNIFKALSAGYRLRPGRRTILAEANSFPTDIYIAEGFAGFSTECELKLEDAEGQTIEEMLNNDVAVVLVNHVNYRTGRLRNMKQLTEAAHAAGAVVVWDLCHSAGALPVELDECNVDFAVGCTYKYLNGGPGSPAFVYVASRHQAEAAQPLSGWWGHARPFNFETHYEGSPAIARFMCGTQPILALRSLEGAMMVWDSVDMHALREKSLKLTDLFISLVEERCGSHGLTLVTPRDHAHRGSQVTFSHPNAYQIVQALIERGVIGDFRAPDAMRFGFTPLYLSYEDVWNAVETMHDILSTEQWKQVQYSGRHAVT